MFTRRGETALFRRLGKLVGKQRTIILSIERAQLEARHLREISSLLAQLKTLQEAFWNAVAARPRPGLVSAARQVDALVEQWDRIARELHVAPAAPRTVAAARPELAEAPA
jgi:hypothetical protein